MKLAKLSLLMFLCACALVARAQQQPMFSQYMFNPLVLNPAYAGSDDVTSVTLLAREQWVGIDGAPSTQTLSAHTPLAKDRIGVGLMLINDRIGPTNQVGVYGSYAYKIPTRLGKLSMGLQVGFNTYRENLSGLTQTDPDDPNFAGDVSAFLPNVGVGLYFEAKNWFVGLSLPQALNHNVRTQDQVVSTEQVRHYFLTGGVLIGLSPDVKIKPNVLLKSVEGAPLEIDLNLNVLLKDIVWVGVGYRSLDAFVFLTEITVTEQFKFGYAYDLTASRLRNVNNGTHELMLNYRFAFKKDKVITPRYF